jgi:hypothetical protein
MVEYGLTVLDIMTDISVFKRLCGFPLIYDIVTELLIIEHESPKPKDTLVIIVHPFEFNIN